MEEEVCCKVEEVCKKVEVVKGSIEILLLVKKEIVKILAEKPEVHKADLEDCCPLSNPEKNKGTSFALTIGLHAAAGYHG